MIISVVRVVLSNSPLLLTAPSDGEQEWTNY